MTAKTMADAAAAALFQVESVHQIHGTKCLCGFESHVSRDRTKHITEATHAALSAAGFGLVADAKAEALEEAAKDLDWVKPEASCEDAESCCGSAASCDKMRPSAYVVGPDWLRKRAATIRATS